MCVSSTESIQIAIDFINSVEVGGGTNIHAPLTKAVNMIKNDIDTETKSDLNYYVNQIIFMTDGEVSNTNQILRDINRLNNLSDIDKYNKKISIFTFGVGSDENDSGWINDVCHSFLKSLAVNNNGFYKRIKQSNTDLQLTEYFNILSNPIATNISIKYNNKNIRNLTETHFNAIYSGSDIIVSGQIENVNDLRNFNL